MLDRKTEKRIKKMKKNEEITLSFNEETIDIICIEKQQYLIFTPDSFYEINYNDLIKKLK